jgi:hypothetical protein
MKEMLTKELRITQCVMHSKKWRVDSTRKNRHACVSRIRMRVDTQTCGNDTFACEIHTPACRFLNIFLLRHAQFFRTHAECNFDTHECDFSTQSVISTRTSVISAHRVWFSHAVNSTRIILFSISRRRVKSTLTAANESYRPACRIDTPFFTVWGSFHYITKRNKKMRKVHSLIHDWVVWVYFLLENFYIKKSDRQTVGRTERMNQFNRAYFLDVCSKNS